jgi:hypothetical protein
MISVIYCEVLFVKMLEADAKTTFFEDTVSPDIEFILGSII